MHLIDTARLKRHNTSTANESIFAGTQNRTSVTRKAVLPLHVVEDCSEEC